MFVRQARICSREQTIRPDPLATKRGKEIDRVEERLSSVQFYGPSTQKPDPWRDLVW